jgi:hypothetical protein
VWDLAFGRAEKERTAGYQVAAADARGIRTPPAFPSRRDEGPGELVESGAKVVSDISEAKAKTKRRRLDAFQVEAYAVTLAFVFGPGDEGLTSLEVAHAETDVLLKSLGVDYRPAPLEPRAVERPGHPLTSP